MGAQAFLWSPALLVLGSQVWLLLTAGQSWGKRWLGLTVVDVQGARPEWQRLAVRELFRLVIACVAGMGVVLVLADAAFVLGPGRQTIHDRLAGTYVVNRRRAMGAAPPALGYAPPPSPSVGLGLAGLASAVAVVVGSFAAMILPNLNYFRHRDARSAVEMDLDGIREAELRYFGRHGRYLPVGDATAAAAVPVGPEQLGWVDTPHWQELGWRPGAEVYAVYWVETTPHGFVAYARRDLDGDGAAVVDSATQDAPPAIGVQRNQ